MLARLTTGAWTDSLDHSSAAVAAALLPAQRSLGAAAAAAASAQLAAWSEAGRQSVMGLVKEAGALVAQASEVCVLGWGGLGLGVGG